MKPESRRIARIHGKMKLICLDIDRWKVADGYTSGVPDCHYDAPNGRVLWVEYKYTDELPNLLDLSGPKMLSALQLRWLKRKHDRKFNVAVMLGCKKGNFVARKENWERKLPKAFVEKHLMTDIEYIDWIKEQLDW